MRNSSAMRSGLMRDQGRNISHDRCGSGWLNDKIEAGSETHRAQQPQMIFGKALLRIADCAEETVL